MSIVSIFKGIVNYIALASITSEIISSSPSKLLINTIFPNIHAPDTVAPFDDELSNSLLELKDIYEAVSCMHACMGAHAPLQMHLCRCTFANAGCEIRWSTQHGDNKVRQDNNKQILQVSKCK